MGQHMPGARSAPGKRGQTTVSHRSATRRLPDRSRRTRGGAIGRAAAEDTIARALLKRPRVLIFEGATSALDPATAEQLAKTINSLKGMATLIFIAHVIPKSLHVDGVMRIAPRLTVVSQQEPETAVE